tara:strand:- start:195663 stop:196634 length:972 start_codon:yes stop_codon:yes gene_type:complete
MNVTEDANNTEDVSTKPAPRIAVAGSINMDLVIRCAALPMPGQTVLADHSEEICGGKGANQAVSAARVGGQVTMIGRVGSDAFAGRLVDNLMKARVDCRTVIKTPQCASGLAIVAVENGGQNAIMVVAGANGRFTPSDIHEHRDVIEQSDALLLQLEIPIDAVLSAIEIAKAARVKVILDPAPMPSQWPRELLQVDLLCPNESEAAALCGFDVESDEQVAAALRQLHSQGARHVVITRGEKGCDCFDGETITHIDAVPIRAVDTTAAGDAFAGALGVHWTQHRDFIAAVEFANAAGALAASRSGAQPAMGTLTEIETLRSSVQ